jgi:hypothetical protein
MSGGGPKTPLLILEAVGSGRDNHRSFHWHVTRIEALHSPLSSRLSRRAVGPQWRGSAVSFLHPLQQGPIPGHLRGESDSRPRARSEYTAVDLRLRVYGEAGR